MLPSWLIKRTPKSKNIKMIRTLLGDGFHTVCESAKCPNIGECFSCGTVTFMILGDVCTRACAFCGVKKGRPSPVDANEPKKVAEAAKKLDLKYVVVTSVTRDDIPDGGAKQFADTIKELRNINKDMKIEVLIPDFGGNINSLKTVLDAKPDVLNHNLEMAPRLYKSVRPSSDYERSKKVLTDSKQLNKEIPTKSGFMLGLGETEEEVKVLLKEMKDLDVDIVTIGQYISPTQNSASVVEYVRPEKFEQYQDFGRSLGIKKVFSGPFVRSSYHAGQY
jgi:lipoyl synthase